MVLLCAAPGIGTNETSLYPRLMSRKMDVARTAASCRPTGGLTPYRVPRHSGRSLEQSTFVSFVRRCARHRGAGDAWRSVGLVRRWGPTLVDKQNRTC